MASLIVGGLGLLNLTIMGVSIKEILPTAIAFSWKMFLTYRHSKLLSKLSKMIISYTEGKYPHKQLLKDMKKQVKILFKRHSKSDIVQIIQYYKELKDLFYATNFNDSYWEENKKELLVNPIAMRDYMIKKIYIERIKDIIVVKCYNNILSKEDLQELETDLLDCYMNKQIKVASLDKAIEHIEEQCKLQYNSQKERYDNDFKDEKQFIKEILEKSKQGLPRVLRTALTTTQDIVNDCKNDIGQDNYTSKFLNKTRSLTETSSLNSIDEESNNKSISNTILNMLN